MCLRAQGTGMPVFPSGCDLPAFPVRVQVNLGFASYCWADPEATIEHVVFVSFVWGGLT